jgi:3-oxoadipate enol-lactonase
LTDFVTVGDGTRLAYRVDGAAGRPVLLFINSLGTDMMMWQSQIAALERDYLIVRYDMRGHGQSAAPPGPYSLERLGRDALALIDHLQQSAVDLCGISLGGLTVQWLAANYPHRVRRVVLANTAARIGSADGWDARIAAVRAGGMAAIREIVLARFFSPAYRTANMEAARAIGDTLEAIAPRGYIGACLALRDADLRSAVSRIQAPVLIVAGAADEATPLVQAEELHEAIAGSELAVLQGAGHLSNIEQPEAFNRIVLSFLSMH